jgi:type II restriction-modification system restriction subunit
MPVIDSKSKTSKFDSLLRTNKDDALMAFIKASYNARKLENRKEKIAENLKLTYDLYKEKGSGSYGDGKRNIIDQFESHYTMGYEMGIWVDNDFTLNDLAIDVAKYVITIKEYIGTVFKNLFTYYDVEGTKKYHHFLYEVLMKIKSENLIDSIINKEVIQSTLPIEEKQQQLSQANLLFNYLISSDIFEKIDKSSFKISEKYRGKFNELISSCNLEFSTKEEDEAIQMAKSKEEYSKYVTKKAIDLYRLEDNFFEGNEMNIIYKSEIKSLYDHNRILFGAPGTGKSYTLNKQKKELLKHGGGFERVTFHPDYSYAHFVGTYKPVSNENDGISYEYVPGPFMRTYVAAMKSANSNNPKPYLLIIEEINRANVAGVFGDVFQLLDRNSENISEYPIQTSEDMRKFLSKELGGDSTLYTEIKIPDNMFIWATMNSADQGVYPMDTAFKRRWNFTYLGINDNEEGILEREVSLGRGEYARTVKWNELRKAINIELLEECKVNEDKLLGPYFVAKNCLENNEKFVKVFKNKIIMYLFDDAAKHKRSRIFSGCDTNNIYSEICKEFDEKGIFIFSERVQEKFSREHRVINEIEDSNYSTDISYGNKKVAERKFNED